MGKPGPAENFPRNFEVCPECGKKGVYVRNWSFHIDMKEKCCRYCGYRGKPFFDGIPVDPAKELADLRRAIHELNTLITDYCVRWNIPAYGKWRPLNTPACSEPDAPAPVNPDSKRLLRI